MALVPDLKKYIDLLEIKYKSAVAESTFTKIAGMVNFIGHRTHEKKDFFVNGTYRAFLGQNGVDGITIFQFDAEIFAVYMFNTVAGSGGTTELDIKKQTASGGAYSTIFTTTPKIDASAGNSVRIGTGETGSGMVAPVLISTPFNVSAGEALRVDVLQAQTGDPQNCGIILHYRPR